MRSVSAIIVAGSAVVAACGSPVDSQVLPYSANLTAVIGGGSAQSDPASHKQRYHVVETPDGDGCVDEAAQECLEPQKECGDDGTSDLLVDARGKPLATLCYPIAGVTVQDVEGDLSSVGNNTIFVLDDEDDGADVTGAVTIDGNNVTLYGHGPAVSVVAGDLHIAKNNARVRGVRIQGDVVIDKNNPSLVDCVIEGDLTIHGNNVALALCDVWGSVTIDGNNALLVEDRFAHSPEFLGQNAACNGDLSFVDENDDGMVDDAELGDAISCPAAER